MSVRTEQPLLIGGRPQLGAGEPLVVTDPWDGAPVAAVPSASAAQVADAIDRAVAAYATYRRAGAHRRAELLARAAQLLEERADELAETIVSEAGKTIREARTECARAAGTLRIAAEEATRIGGEVVPLDALPLGAGHVGHVRRFPVGPVAAITPFNSPLNLVAHKVGPALAAGNTVLVKPADRTPVSALALGEIVARAAEDAGAPAGVISVLPCRADVAQRLVSDERIRVLTFTGSAAVGWKLRALAGTKRVLLELGALGAAIVEPDADLRLAAARCRVGAFAAAGQVCASVQRILVHRSVHDELLALLLDEVAGMRVGNPREEATDMGPLISPAAAARVAAWTDEALSGGARLLTGGEHRGSLMEPTVVAGSRPDMRISCQEVFGPVVAVDAYDSLDDAIRIANATPFGLQGSLFTRDVRTIHRAHAELELGSLIVNDAGTWRVDQMPFGGAKASGVGREGLKYAIREQTDERLLVVNLEEDGA